MTKVLITQSKLDDLAETIGAKTGQNIPLTIDQMKNAIYSITIPRGTKSITENGAGIDIAQYANIDVNVQPTFQSKSTTPSTAQQTITADSGYDGLSQVTVNPIPSQYIVPTGTKSISENGTGIDVAQYASVDVAVPAEDNTLVVTLSRNESTQMWEPDCTYAEALAAHEAGKTVAFETPSPQDETVSGEYTSFGGGAFVYTVSTVSYDSESGNASGSVDTTHMWNSSEIRVIGTSTAWRTDNATAAPSDVMSGAVFYNANGKQVGTFDPTPTLQSKTATPTESQQTVSPDSGYDGLSNVTVDAIPSTYVGSGITQRSSSDLRVGGATITAPAGYYESSAQKTIPSGTEGTPRAIKGTVNNHAVTVTPSVTNSAGYITGSEKTGTAVTVNASELVSGTLSITSSGTHDVTNYASASIAEGSATAPSSINGTAATVSTGTNTLTLTKSVSVTPSVTAGYISSGTAGNSSVSLTASIPTKAAATITPSTTNQTIAANTYLTGAQTITGDADLVASNIISTANIFGVQGSVVIQNYYMGSSAPSSSLGQNGDIYLQE